MHDDADGSGHCLLVWGTDLAFWQRYLLMKDPIDLIIARGRLCLNSPMPRKDERQDLRHAVSVCLKDLMKELRQGHAVLKDAEGAIKIDGKYVCYRTKEGSSYRYELDCAALTVDGIVAEDSAWHAFIEEIARLHQALGQGEASIGAYGNPQS